MLAGATILCKTDSKGENKRGNGLEVSLFYNVKEPKFITERIKMLIVDNLIRPT